ncbi:hypothetical protein [Bdellovibrio svalbardensis]|uniref:Uncharacterized protein n=1 Tax=Bdellovibrio svalbardensis TaxID=2972972 RepID=A0ABT6DHX8_9BACT|nr:hypothetical protein [Bdellovibrio svalbardensis]MDG0815840.1 hypothetical protein [Bdellovibrio svalbardensis]
MKKLTGLWLLLILAIAPAGLVWADESVETEVVETLLDPARVAQQEKLLIKLSEDKVFSFDAIPDREQMKEALGLKLPEKVKEQIIARGGSLEEIDPLQPYESMAPESRQKFQEMRILFLTNAARILNSTKFVFGAGSVAGDVLSFVKVKTLKAIGKNPEVETKAQRTFQQRSHEAVASVLKGIDYKLFSQAPLVIESNEFGMSVSAGIVAETGVLRKGGGGAEELGFSLAFNKTKRAFVFEIFHNSEKFDNTKAAVSVVGLVGKAGITMGRREGAETLKGSSFYPPAVPGYSTSSADYFSAGLSSSLGLPPPPLADLLTFTNKSERNALIRVTVSPIVKGFVRLQFGDVRGSIRLVTMKFVDVYTAVADKVRAMGRRSCGPVFG